MCILVVVLINFVCFQKLWFWKPVKTKRKFQHENQEAENLPFVYQKICTHPQRPTLGKQWQFNSHYYHWRSVETKANDNTNNSNNNNNNCPHHNIQLCTWCALAIKLKSCFCKNARTTSPPNVHEIPLSFSPQPVMSYREDRTVFKPNGIASTDPQDAVCILPHYFTLFFVL